jgi:hypothetical protein
MKTAIWFGCYSVFAFVFYIAVIHESVEQCIVVGFVCTSVAIACYVRFRSLCPVRYEQIDD